MVVGVVMLWGVAPPEYPRKRPPLLANRRHEVRQSFGRRNTKKNEVRESIDAAGRVQGDLQ
jgi:hypothetical protein